MKYFLSVFFIMISLSSMAQRPLVGSYHVYYGILHNHSELSDGTGTVDQAYNYAKNVSRLDFFSLADHCTALTTAEYGLMRNTADAYNEDGVYTTFWGFEWSSSTLYGHVAILGADDFCSALSLDVNSFSKLCTWLNDRNCVAFFNHPGRENTFGLEFNHFTSAPCDRIVGMELWNKSAGFDNYYYNDGYSTSDGGLGFYDEALVNGWRIGAGGSEDNHSGNWGSGRFRFAILSSELTRSHLLEAMHQRRFYSTLDSNLRMSFKIHGHEMGSVITPGSYNGTIELEDGNGELFTQVDLLRNGHVFQTFILSDMHPVIPITILAQPGDYYYIRVRQADADEAISAPIFVDSNIPLNHLPSVVIDDPLQGSVYFPGNIQIGAHASDTNGIVRRVLFFVNGQYVGADTTSPYAIQYQGDTVGNYQLKALAMDDLGAIGQSEIVNFTITQTSSVATTLFSENTPQLMVINEGGAYAVMLTGTVMPEFYELFSINGSLIFSGLLEPGLKDFIPKENLTTGIYLVRLKTQGLARVVKFSVVD